LVVALVLKHTDPSVHKRIIPRSQFAMHCIAGVAPARAKQLDPVAQSGVEPQLCPMPAAVQ
jgi:hypothetical protein